MAELVPVAADVQLISGTQDKDKQSGEAIDAGELVYLKSDGKLWLAENDQTTTEAAVYGLALASTPGADQPLHVARPGSVVDLGVTLAVGETYYLASTPGKVEPWADVQSTENVTPCLFAKDADQAIFQPVATGAVKP